MKSRIENIPTLRTVYTAINADRYNTLRLAILRFGAPIHIDLSGLKHLEFIIDSELWLCIDQSLNDLPVIAWTGFHTNARKTLYEPIKCQLRYYHSHADLIAEKALELVMVNINQRLRQALSDTPSPITHFPAKT